MGTVDGLSSGSYGTDSNHKTGDQPLHEVKTFNRSMFSFELFYDPGSSQALSMFSGFEGCPTLARFKFGVNKRSIPALVGNNFFSLNYLGPGP
jgi:hypothetical protein